MRRTAIQHNSPSITTARLRRRTSVGIAVLPVLLLGVLILLAGCSILPGSRPNPNAPSEQTVVNTITSYPGVTTYRTYHIQEGFTEVTRFVFVAPESHTAILGYYDTQLTALGFEESSPFGSLEADTYYNVAGCPIQGVSILVDATRQQVVIDYVQDPCR